MSDRSEFINWIFGAMLSVCLVFGYEAEFFGEIRVRSLWTYLLLILLTLLCSFLAKCSWNLMIKFSYRASKRKKEKKNRTIKEHNTFLSAAGLISILHFIVFLGEYPGFFTYDAQDELIQTVTRNFNNRHPMLHVLSLGGVIQFFHKLTGSYNVGIAAFILLGMLVSSMTYAFVVYLMKKQGLERNYLMVLTGYFGLFPVIVMYSLCSTKDGIFSLLLILLVIEIKKLVDNPDKFYKTPVETTVLVVLLTFMMLYRNNGVYAFCVFAVILLAFFRKKILMNPKYRKRFFASCAFALIAYFLINTTLLFVTKAQSVGHGEILTVPIQQLARVYDYDRDSLSNEQLEAIEKYIPLEALDRYNPKCSDLVKIDFKDEEFNADRLGFFRIWMELGVKNPVAYLDAFVMTSYGLWCPGAVIDGYEGNTMFTYTYGKSSYFGYEVEPPGERTSLIPFIDSVYRYISIGEGFQHLPLIGLLFSPGFVLWIYLFLLSFMLYMKKELDAVAYLLPLLVVLTCFLGPISLVRYSLYLWTLVPIVIIELKLKRCYVTENEKDHIYK